MTLDHVLSQTGSVTITLENLNADQLKKAARFWVGQEAYKFRKAECLDALNKVINGK